MRPKGRTKPFALLSRGLKSGASRQKQVSKDELISPTCENGPPVFLEEQRGPTDDDRAMALLEKKMYEEAHQECWPVVAVVDIAKSVGDVSDLYTTDSSLHHLEEKVDQLASRYSEALKLLVERYREKEEKREPYGEEEEGELFDDANFNNADAHSLDTGWAEDESLEKGNLYGDALYLMLNGELAYDDDEETEARDHNEAGCKYFQTLEHAADFSEEIYRNGEEDMQGCRRTIWDVADCGAQQQPPGRHVNDVKYDFRAHESKEEEEDDVTTKSSFPYVSSSYECTSGEGGKGSVTSSVRRYVGAAVAEVLTSDKRRPFTRSFPVFGTRGSKNLKDAEVSLESGRGLKTALEEVTRDDEEDSIDMLFESAAKASEALENFEQFKSLQKSENPVGIRACSARSNALDKPTCNTISAKTMRGFSPLYQVASPENETGFSPLSRVSSSEEDSSYSEFDAIALTDVLLDAREDENAAGDLEYILSGGQQHEIMSPTETNISGQRIEDLPIQSSLILLQKTASWECAPRVCGGGFNKTRKEVVDTDKSHKRSDDVYREGLYSGNTSDDGAESQVSQDNDGWVCAGTNVIFTKRLDYRRGVRQRDDRVPDVTRQNGQRNEEKKCAISAKDGHGTREPCENSAPTGICHGTRELLPESQYSCNIFQSSNMVSRTGLGNDDVQVLTGKRSDRRKPEREKMTTASKASEPDYASDGEKTVVVILKYQHESDNSDDEDGVVNDEEQEKEPEQVKVQVQVHEKEEDVHDLVHVDKEQQEKAAKKVEGSQRSILKPIFPKRPRSSERVLGRLVMQVWRKRSNARRHFFELPSVAAPSSIRNEESTIDDDGTLQGKWGVLEHVGKGAWEDIIEREPVALVDGGLEGQLSKSCTPAQKADGIAQDLVPGSQAEDAGDANCQHTCDPSNGDGHDRQMKKGNRLSSLGKKTVPVLLRKNKSLPSKNDIITKNVKSNIRDSQVDTHEKHDSRDFIGMTNTTEIGRISPHDSGAYRGSPTSRDKSKLVAGSLTADDSLLPSHEEAIAEFSIGKGHTKKEGRGCVTEDFVRVVSDESASSKKSRTALVFKRWLKGGKKPVHGMPIEDSREEEYPVEARSRSSSDQKEDPNHGDNEDYDEPIDQDELDEREESDNTPSSKEQYVMWMPESFSSMFVAQEAGKEFDAWASISVNASKQQAVSSSNNVEDNDMPVINSLPTSKIGKGEKTFEEFDDDETNTIIEGELPYENDIHRGESVISWISASLSTLFADPMPQPQVHLPARELMASVDQRPFAPRTGGSVSPLERKFLRRNNNITGTVIEEWNDDDDDGEEDTETKDDKFLMEVEEARVLNANFRGRAVDDFLGYVAGAIFTTDVDDKTSDEEAEIVTDYEGDSTDDSPTSSKCDLSPSTKPAAALEPCDKTVEEDARTDKSSVQHRRGNVIALVTRARRSFTKRQSTKNDKSPSLTGTEALKSASSYTSKADSEGDQSESSAAIDQGSAISASVEKNRSIVHKEQVSHAKVSKLSKGRRGSFRRNKETETRQIPKRPHPIEQRGPLDGLWEYFDFAPSIDEEEEWSDAGSDDDSSYDTGMVGHWTYNLPDPLPKERSPTGKLSQIAEVVHDKRSKRSFAEKNENIVRRKRGEVMRRRHRRSETPPELNPLAVVQGTALSLGRQVSRVADELQLAL